MPDTPLLDRAGLEDAFSKYQASTIDSSTIPSTPFKGLSTPTPETLLGANTPLSPIEQAERQIFANDANKSGKLKGGSIPTSTAALTNNRYNYFNPDQNYNNEDAAALGQSFLDKAANGVIKMAGIAAETAISSSLGTINGLAEWSKTGRFSSFYNNDFSHYLDDKMKEMENMFPHYQTARQIASDWYEPVNLFSGNFLFDKIVKNLGFSLGAAVPALGVAKALNAIRLSSKLFAAGEALAATEAVEAAQLLPRAQQLGFIEGKLRSFASNGLKFLGAPLQAGKEQSGNLVKGIASILSASGESSMEAYNNLNEFRNNRIKEYKDKFGVEPTGADLDNINQQADHVGNASFGLNMALLSGTEYVQLPKIFSSTFKGEKNLLNATIKNAKTGLLEEAAPKGFGKFLSQAKGVGSLFFNEVEAFEEGAQFTVQTGTQDYYNKKYRGEGTDFLSSLGYGVKQALTTPEGLENIFLGGFSGALMTSGFAAPIGIGSAGKLQERGWTGYGGQKAANTSEFIAGANANQFTKYIKEGVEQANRAISIQEQREQAIRQGDILESKDLEFDYSHNYLSHRIKWGRFDLVEDDINSARQQAATAEGFAQLQQEGKAANTDTKETFLKRLDNFERHSKSVKDQYESLNTKYGGLVDKEGKAVYTPEVIDKMVYAASKIQDYNQRVPELSRSLMSSGIAIANILETKDPKLVQEAIAQIDAINDTDEVKDSLKQNLRDVLEMSYRREKFIEDFNKIKKTPSEYKEAGITPTAAVQAETVKVKTKTGEEDLAVGEEYFLGKVVEYDKNGKEVVRFPRLTILGENADGTIKIKDGNGQIRDVSKDVLEDYQLGKVSDTLNNKKAKFFMENVNTIFEFNFGKGEKKKGRLEYSHKDKVLNFVYRNKFGKISKIEVTGDQFVPRKGFNNPMISAVGQLTVGQNTSLEEFTKEKDERVNAKRGNRLEIIGNLIDENNTKLEELNKKIFAKKEKLNKAKEDIAELATFTTKDKYGKVIPVAFNKVLQKSMSTLSDLSSLKTSLEKEIEELEAYKEELEFNAAYFHDLVQNIDELPTDSKEFLQELKDQYEAVINQSLNVGEQINSFTKMIEDIKSLIKDLLSFLQSSFAKFDKDYPDEIRNSLKDDEEVFKSPQDLKNYIADYTLIKDLKKDINLNEEKIQPIVDKIEALYKELSQLEKEASAKWAVLNKFEQAVKEFKKQEAIKKAFIENKAIQEKYFVQQKALEQQSGTPTEEYTGNQNSTVKDIAFALPSSTDPEWNKETKDNNFHRRHQTFLFNTTSTNPEVFSQEEVDGKKAKDRLRILPVTSVTAEALGFPKDWIEPEYTFDGNNVDGAAIRYVYVIEEGNKLFYVDEKGNKISDISENKPLDPSKIIYSNAESSKPNQGFTNKDDLNEKDLLQSWRNIRKQLFSITPETIQNYPQEFKISRGFPSKTEGVSRNTNILDAKLATQEDLATNVVIQVPTASSKFPAGIPLLNFNGNTVFLNNRNFTSEEASNIFDILLYAASHKEGLTNEIFNYLSNVLYFSTSIKEGQGVKRNQIFLKRGENEAPVLVVGSNQIEIPFNIDGLNNNKTELIKVLENMYHHVNNNTLLKLKDNPNTPFQEIGVNSKGELFTKKEYPSYQHYLLEGKNSPLTANINIPVEGEPSIKEKYSIVQFSTYDPSKFKSTSEIKPPVENTTKEEIITREANGIQFTANVKRNAEGKAESISIQSAIPSKDILGEDGAVLFKKGEDIKTVMGANIAGIEANMLSALNQEEIKPEKAETKEQEVVQKAASSISKEDTIEFKINGHTFLFNVDRDADGLLSNATIKSIIEDESKQEVAENLPEELKKQIVENAIAGYNHSKSLEIHAKEIEKEQNTLLEEDPTDDLDGAVEYQGDVEPRSTFYQWNKYEGDKDVESADIEFELPKVKVKMVDSLIKTSGGGTAWGAARSAMMEIYEGAPFGTKYHEAFEQIFNWVLTPKAQNELWEEFKQREGTFTTFKGETKKFSEAGFKEAKEQMAEEFIEYKQSNVTPKRSSKIVQFFKDLWNMIKEMLNAKPATLASVFDKLNKGAYRMAPLRTATNVEYRERNVQNEAVSFVNTVLAGMTADMFIDKWKNDVSLILDLEERPGYAERELFSNLLNRLTDYYENKDNPSGIKAYFKSKLNQDPSPQAQADTRAQYEAIQKAWKRVKGQWFNYTEDMKSFLKIFDISFQVSEDGEIEVAPDETSERDERGMSEYNEDKMSVNAKNSASKTVKLLMATISDSEFVKKTVANSLQTRGNDLTQVQPIRDNVMRMRMLAPYAKLFNYVLYNTANIPGIYNMADKLQDLAANTQLKQNANIKSLLNRIGFNTEKGFEGKNIGEIKMILKLENAFSKQKPTFVRQEVNEQGKTVFKLSNIFDRVSQLTEQWGNNLKSLKYTTVKGDAIQFSPSIIASDPYIFLSNLNIPITKGSFPLKKDGKNLEEELLKELDVIKNIVKKYIENPLPIIAKGKGLGIDSRLKNLAKFYTENIEGESTESQHKNMAGKVTANFVLPNFISHLLSDVNAASTLEGYIALNPQYKDLYMGDSYFLNNILYKDGKRNKQLSLAVVEGKNIYNDGRPTDKMNEGERMLYEINNNLNGYFYTLMPADSKLEYALNVGNLVPETFFNSQGRVAAVQEYIDQMYKSYLNEVQLMEDYESRKNIVALTRKEDGVEVGKQLRFFKYILSNENVNKTHSGKTISKEEFSKDVLDFITKQAEQNIQDLRSWGLIEQDSYMDNSLFNVVYGLDNDFIKRNFNKDGREHNMSDAELLDLFKFREMNYVFNNIEMHRFIFNDPYQYKDELKAIRSFTSGREATHVDTLNDQRGLNDALKNTLNKGLKPSDIGWTNFKNHLNSVTVNNILTVSKEFDILKKLLGKKVKKYGDMDIADGQSWAHGNAYREILYKSGGRFTAQQEELHQWLMAWERRDKNKYSSEELRKADEKILEKPIPSSDKHVMYILKPIISGTKLVNGVATQYLYKTSTAPLYSYFLKGTPLEKVHNTMTEKGIDFLAMQSVVKRAGVLSDNTITMFDKNGELHEDFNNVIPTPIDYKYFGIQVDTASQKEEQTQGSQLTKLAILDLMSVGVPMDFISKQAGKTQEEIYKLWNAIEDKRAESKVYSLVQDHKDVLIALAIKRGQKVFDKLGIKKGDFGYSYEDKSVVAEYILRELERRELPENIKQGVSTKYDPETGTQEFTSPLESNVNYQKIKQILWSIIEKGVTRPKMPGGPKVQMSVAGMGNIREVEINGKKAYVDDTLKYYGVDKNGNTTPCEIDLPYFFGDKLRASMKAKGKEFKNDEEFFSHILNYLNNTEEGQSLLKGIGFRIPTQKQNSIEYFKVRKFLSPQLGDMVVLPAEITTKAGSDFDVDKLNTYLKNWYIGKSGYPKAVKLRSINSNSEADLKEVYEYTLKNKRKAWEAKVAGNQLMNDVFELGEEAERIPSLEEFIKESKGKSSLELNTIEALENHYIETLEKLMALPENLKALLIPNDASQLENLSAEIQQLTGNIDFDINPGHLVSSNFMAKKRNTLLASKGSVGMGAVSATNNAINQQEDITIGLPQRKGELNPAVRLPHNTINGKISLSGVYTTSGDNISDINSQFVDGSVDVAKKEWLPRMGFTDRTIPVALALNGIGTPIRHIGMFINQPAIQAYLKAKEINKGLSKYTHKPEKAAWKIQNEVGARFSQTGLKAARKSKPKEYSLSDMEAMVGKTSLTEAQGKLQIQMLDDYILYEMMASQRLAFVQGYNYDTARITSPEDMYKKELDEERAKSSTVDSIAKVTTGTYLGTIISTTKKINNALKSLINTQKGEAGNTIKKMAYDLKSHFGIGSNSELYSKYMNKAEGAMIDYIVHNKATIKNLPLNSYTKLFLSSNVNAAKYIQQLKDDVAKDPSHPLANNKLLSNFITDIDITGNKPSTVSIAEPDFDTFTSDTYTDQFRELLDSAATVSLPNVANSATTADKVFKTLIVAQMLQNGSSRKQGSFFHLIPNEIYTEYAAPVLRNIEADLQWYYDQGLFYRNNYKDNKLVPIMKPDFEGETDVVFSILHNVKGKSLYFMNATKYRSFPFLKVVDRKTNTTRLFKRIDSVGALGRKSPLSIRTDSDTYGDSKRWNVIYQEVNILGDGNKAQEYYDNKLTSLYNPTITEVPDGELIRELSGRYSSQNIQYEEIPLLAEEQETTEAENSGENVPVDEQNNVPSQNMSKTKLVEGDIWISGGIPIITTNLKGIHGAGLANQAFKKGLIKYRKEGDFGDRGEVITFPVKKIWSDAADITLVKDSASKLIELANSNPNKVYSLPLVGLGHGEGKVNDVIPIIKNILDSTSNVQLVVPTEQTNRGKQGSARTDSSLSIVEQVKKELFPTKENLQIADQSFEQFKDKLKRKDCGM